MPKEEIYCNNNKNIIPRTVVPTCYIKQESTNYMNEINVTNFKLLLLLLLIIIIVIEDCCVKRSLYTSVFVHAKFGFMQISKELKKRRDGPLSNK